MKTTHYAEDLAYIHDTGFGFWSRGGAPFLLSELRRCGIDTGRVVSLGCGSGIAEATVATAGYTVTGFDQSQEMLRIAARRCKRLDLRNESFVDACIPSCDAVFAFGEVFNYRFDKRANLRTLQRLFRKIFQSLTPGGLLLFDLATPQRSSRPEDKHKNFLGKNWALCLQVSKTADSSELTRTMTLFRQVGKSHYRRSDEIHTLKLYEPAKVAHSLRSVGFRVRQLNRYGDMSPVRGLKVFSAKKPTR